MATLILRQEAIDDLTDIWDYKSLPTAYQGVQSELTCTIHV